MTIFLKLFLSISINSVYVFGGCFILLKSFLTTYFNSSLINKQTPPPPFLIDDLHILSCNHLNENNHVVCLLTKILQDQKYNQH